MVPRRADVLAFAASLIALAAATVVLRSWPLLANPTTAALVFLLVVLVTAATSRIAPAIAAAVAADLCLNYFFMPPVGTFRIADPHNLIALVVFLAAGVIASSLSLTARTRGVERELKSALLASIAHDLRTPLTAIRVAASNLQSTWLTEADRREQTELVLTEVERLTRIFQNILEMARIDAGSVAAEVRWAHPREIVEAAQDQTGPALQHHPLDVAIPGDVLVRLDPRLTAAALAQLLQNAAQYSEPGSPIELSATVDRVDRLGGGARLKVIVRDHGRGIADADLPHVFERLYRGRNGHARPSGTGMGLSIARGLVAAEGGDIRAENCADGGARFTIDVPIDTKPTGSES
ncbi:MAG TPA: DUF4118 domain-containing protein [Vicinamibacterales bacterium]|nr:DUF4118 domain-containing protein [Vicinamibacterales bacterium]